MEGERYLDEPLSNLDAKMRVQVRRELRDMQQRLGLTTILVTHDQDVAGFLSTANILAGKLTGSGPARCFEIDGSANIPIAEAQDTPNDSTLLFRPQHASLVAAATSDGTIANREFLNASIRYGARIGTTAAAVDTPLQSGRELSEVGSQAVFKLAPRSLLWLKADAGGHPESRDWSA